MHLDSINIMSQGKLDQNRTNKCIDTEIDSDINRDVYVNIGNNSSNNNNAK